jgi:hypothetical protein
MTKRQTIKDLLSQLLPKHILFFKRLYANGNLDMDINEVVDKMPKDKLNSAISQCQKTLDDKKKWLAEWRDEQIDNILKDDDTL